MQLEGDLKTPVRGAPKGALIHSRFARMYQKLTAIAFQRPMTAVFSRKRLL